MPLALFGSETLLLPAPDEVVQHGGHYDEEKSVTVRENHCICIL